MSLVESAASGDRLAALQSLRDDLAGRLADCSSDQNYASMSRLLVDVLGQIEAGGGTAAAGGTREETALDEFTRRLRDREPPAEPPRRTEGE